MSSNRKWPPLSWMADRMGYTIPGVSRLRGGRRNPNLSTLLAVEEAFGWSACSQIRLVKEKRWHDEFSRVATKLHREEREQRLKEIP